MMSPDLQRIKHIRDYCMPWNQLKGMRNMFAHSYGKMDHAVIWETAISDVPALLAFCIEELSI